MKRIKSKKPIRNPIFVMMIERYGRQETGHGNKRVRREKDARNSWKNDCESSSEE